MYDKYFSVNTLPGVNVPIPKHKGILVSTNAAATITFIFGTNPGVGGTMSAGLTFSAGTSILPIQPYALGATLASGVTAFYIN